MLDGKRKSMQSMAAQLGVDHQRLQQFVTSSTWDHVEVRKRLAGGPMRFLCPDAYVTDDSGFPRTGSIHPVLRGCTPELWERSETARSASACMR
jgi:SRSO17 transposase